MKKVGERANEVMKLIEHHLSPQLVALLKDAIERALKEQDRLTRHAIAAALGAESEHGEIGLDGNYAQEIAMNTSAA